ncbi:MAG: hypothetical protein R2877_06535 [Bdellovibrionota bacterium]
MMKKYIQVSLLSTLAIFAGCNASEDAFNAPDGATIDFTEPSVSIQFAGPGEVLFMSTLRVRVPIGEGPVPSPNGDITPGAPEMENGNKIQGVVSCGRCNLYVFKDGVETYLPQISLIDPVASGSFTFTTDEQGLYTFVFGVLSPASIGFVNADGDILAYTDEVRADIRVAQGRVEISAEPAQ